MDIVPIVIMTEVDLQGHSEEDFLSFMADLCACMQEVEEFPQIAFGLAQKLLLVDVSSGANLQAFVLVVR